MRVNSEAINPSYILWVLFYKISASRSGCNYTGRRLVIWTFWYRDYFRTSDNDIEEIITFSNDIRTWTNNWNTYLRCHKNLTISLFFFWLFLFLFVKLNLCLKCLFVCLILTTCFQRGRSSNQMLNLKVCTIKHSDCS